MGRPVADTIEDLEDLAAVGVGGVEAAKRLGFPSLHALEMWLYRWNRYDLYRKFRALDPPGLHHAVFKKWISDPVRSDNGRAVG